ncbi:MAG: hypothetical protein GF334_07895 [Candidatus Altiarchaeales archaeon]|nr:hypothetical protein [Candidatus Altiarchaeales archaeon]
MRARLVAGQNKYKRRDDYAKSEQFSEVYSSILDGKSEEQVRETLNDLQRDPVNHTNLNRGNLPGAVFQMMCEFLSLISPNQTLWSLKHISHPRTAEKIKKGTPFEDTAFGHLVMRSGWQPTPPSIQSPQQKKDTEKRGTPLLQKNPQHQPGPEWISHTP